LVSDREDARRSECHGDDLEVVGFREVRAKSAGDLGPVVARRVDFRCRECGCDGFILRRVGSAGETSREPRVVQIPVPGGSARVPTGALQFRDDWPGLFVRGDDAIGLMVSIRHLADRLAGSDDSVVVSALSRLIGIANIIERDVVVRRADA
jgi:hypothetical protein